jgi:small subunit ribosomal protein S1
MKNDNLMKKILEKYKLPKEGEIVESTVIDKSNAILYVDLGEKGTGIVFGREYIAVKDKIKNLKKGDKIFAKIISLDGEEGFIELSLREMDKIEKIKELEKLREEGKTLEIKVQKFNRGGLLTKVLDMPAFLPISQLSERVLPEDLVNYVGKTLKVKILSILSSGEVILSEKMCEKEKLQKEIEKFKEGEEIEGEISGVTEFGVFVKFGEIEALALKDEISENLNPKIGEKVKAKILKIDKDKVFLSLK